MVDAVVQHWRIVHQPNTIKEMALFYADDGLITGHAADRVQDSIDIITEAFGSMGLKMNAQKTEFMVMTGARRYKLSQRAFNRQFTNGPTYEQRRSQRVMCLKCGSKVGRASLKRHQLSLKCRKASETYEPPTPIRQWAAEEQAKTPIVEIQTYQTSIPRGQSETLTCPVEGCDWIAGANHSSKRRALRLHFRHRHVEQTIVIAEEGQLPRCI
mmetsp:Transcript_2818/g.3994  ORF Transcript_2818/g.3994 Transcript_2818/m.3994 type:complete len:213 (-) Transcript_2818:632-1270(-)